MAKKIRFTLSLSLLIFGPLSQNAVQADLWCGRRPEPLAWIEEEGLRRNLGCNNYSSNSRAMQICCGIERELEWQWMGGHFSVAPGWIINFSGIRNVYCKDKISTQDLTVLDQLYESAMSQMDKSQLENGAKDLTRLINGEQESPVSIFNPTNPNYLLRGGCK